MPEKTINQLPRELRPLFTKGNDALQRENFDYAIAILTPILEKEPAMYECRKALRAAQQGKTGSGSGFFKKMLSNASSSPQLAKAQMALRKDPTEALNIAEQILNSDAHSSPAHRIVVEAAEALDFPHTATYSYEVLVNNSPRDKKLAIGFANALANIGEVARGEQLLIDLANEFPADPELNQAVKNLSARKTLNTGGYETIASGEGSYRDILRNKEEAVSLEQEKRVVKNENTTDRLLGEYEARLVNEPGNLKLLRSLAELYREKKEFEKALGYYQQIKASAMGNDSSLDEAIAETNVRRFDYQIEQLDATAPDYADRVAQLKAEKTAYQMAECQKRVERFPTDLAIRFEMGKLYFEAGKNNEAIQEFQKAKGNPNKRVAAMGYLAQCYAKRKMYDLAARTLQDAIKEKPIFDEEKKEMVYNLGSVLELAGKKEEAAKQYELIFEVDIGYKDVAAKMDSLQG